MFLRVIVTICDYTAAEKKTDAEKERNVLLCKSKKKKGYVSFNGN